MNEADNHNSQLNPNANLPLDPDAPQPGRYQWPPHFSPRLIFVVFIGGCAGALARYGITLALPTLDGSWPFATMTVNFVGCLLLGILLESLARRGKDEGIRRVVRLLLGTGFIGAFTTYSSFAVETDSFFKDGSLLLALGYLAASIAGGVALSAIGIAVAAAYHKRQEVRS